MRRSPNLSWIIVLSASAAALMPVASLAGSAQRAGGSMVEEVTVEGRIPRHVAPPPTYNVGHADLDLTTPSAVEELKRRVRVAANYVCVQATPSVLDDQICQTKAVMEVHHDQLPAVIRDQPQPFTPGPSWTPPPGRN
jgi:UrcA family protein